MPAACLTNPPEGLDRAPQESVDFGFVRGVHVVTRRILSGFFRKVW